MAADQQTTKQHPIPQQVLGVQFKLVGDLTLRQFGYLAGFGLLAYLALSFPLPSMLRFGLALLLGGAGVGFALVPVNDQPLDQWFSGLLRAIYAPTRWVWEKTAEPPAFLAIPTVELARTVEEGFSPEEARTRLEEYLATIREEGALEPVDLAEAQRLSSINEEIQEFAPSLPPAMFAPAPAVTPLGQIRPEVTEGIPPAQTSEIIPTEEPTPPSPLPAPAPVQAAPVPVPLPPQRQYVKVEGQPFLASTINYAAEPILKIQRGKSVTYTTALRNVRVGRKVRIIPAGEVVFAPARERVLAVEEKPLPSLEMPAVQAPTQLETVEEPPASAVPPALPGVTPLPAPIPIKETPPPPPPPAAPALPVTKTEEPGAQMPTAKELEPTPLAQPALPPIERAKIPMLAREPNAVSGFVRSDGAAVEGALVLIKDKTGTTLVATRSDRLGYFAFSPLPNGQYSVELPRGKQKFAIMKIALTGVAVPPLEIRPEERHQKRSGVPE